MGRPGARSEEVVDAKHQRRRAQHVNLATRLWGEAVADQKDGPRQKAFREKFQRRAETVSP